MKTSLLHVLVGLVAIAMIAGCTKKPQSRTAKLLEDEEDVDLTAHLTGIDETTAVEVEEEEQPEMPTEPTDTGPQETSEDVIGGNEGAFLANLVLNGQETPGTFTVKRATTAGEVVKQDIPTGKEIRLDPGLYDFVFQTDAIVGKPEFTLRDVEIPAGRRIKRDVKMPVGKITLVTGGKCQKKPIRIRQSGASEWYQGKFYTCVEMTLLAGTYDAEMGKGKHGIPISGIQVYDGGIRDVLIRRQ